MHYVPCILCYVPDMYVNFIVCIGIDVMFHIYVFIYNHVQLFILLWC